MLFYYQSWMFYNHLSHFISSFGTNLLTWCQVPVAVVCMFFTSQEINIKRSPNATKLHGNFFWTRRNIMGPGCSWGSLEEGTPHQGAPGGPGAPWCVVPTSVAPWTASLLYKYPNIPETQARKSIPVTAESRTTRSNLGTITEGFIMPIGASPMMRE